MCILLLYHQSEDDILLYYSILVIDYGPLQMGSKVVQQIEQRKDGLNRHISRLEKQLAFRKKQLNQHHELSEIVTARVETARVNDIVSS